MPATKGRREVDERYDAAPPTEFKPRKRAMAATIQPTPRRSLRRWIPLTKPSGPLTAELGAATSSANVPEMYPTARTVPPTRMANGILRRGFSISSPIAEPDSTPPNAKKTLDQKMALPGDQWGMRLATEK